MALNWCNTSDVHMPSTAETITQGWYSSAKRIPSPNFNTRPEGANVSLLVIHNISLPPGEFGSDNIERFFLNQLPSEAHPYFETISHLEVSAHCLIKRDGELVQFVAFDKRAWHAGASSFEGLENCNDFAIGVELEGTDTAPYTEQQYRVLVALTRDLLTYYPQITTNRIVGHSSIAPERKTDPGPAFDWPRYLTALEPL